MAAGLGALSMGQIAAAGSAAILGTVGVAAVAGLGAYYLTSWAMERFRPRTKDEKVFAAAMAYREARKDATVRLNRPLTHEENAALGAIYKARRDEILSGR